MKSHEDILRALAEHRQRQLNAAGRPAFAPSSDRLVGSVRTTMRADQAARSRVAQREATSAGAR